MPRSTEFRVRTFSGFRAWVIVALVLAIGAAIIGAVAVVAIGILLFLLPVLILAAFLSYAFMWLRRGKRVRQRPSEPGVIEGEYRVLDATEVAQRSDHDTEPGSDARS